MMYIAEPIAVVDLFPELHHHLLELLASLSDEQWLRPTVCPGWSAKDVALHLLGGQIANLSRRRDGIPNAIVAYVPPGTDLSAPGAFVPILNEWNEHWVAAARRMSTRVLRELLAMTGEQLSSYFRGLDMTAIGSPVGWAGPEPAPVWLDVAREFTEQWMHQAQIRDAVGVPGIRERRLFAPVIATFMHALPWALRNTVASEGTRLRVVITGEAGGEWYAERYAGGWVLRAAPTVDSASTAMLTAEDAWRIWTKGLPQDESARVVRTTGDDRLAKAVLDMVAFLG